MGEAVAAAAVTWPIKMELVKPSVLVLAYRETRINSGNPESCDHPRYQHHEYAWDEEVGALKCHGVHHPLSYSE